MPIAGSINFVQLLLTWEESPYTVKLSLIPRPKPHAGSLVTFEGLRNPHGMRAQVHIQAQIPGI